MKEIMENWRNTVDQLNETTYSRILQKVEDMKVPLVVVSADRHEYSRSQNDERYMQLKNTVKNAGFPFAGLHGSWVEKDEEGNEVRVIEKSVIIYDEERGDVKRTGIHLFDLAKEISRKFDQEAFIFGETGSETGRMFINAFGPQGNSLDYGGPWTTLQKIPNDADFWSRVNGTTFVFKEGQEEVIEVDAPNSVIGAMIKANEHKGKKIKFVRKQRKK